MSKPLDYGHMYKCHKQFFRVCVILTVLVLLSSITTSNDFHFQTNIQVIIGHECQIISYDSSWPRSVTDVKMFKQSYLWTHHRNHFQNGEYILMDKGERELLDQ